MQDALISVRFQGYCLEIRMPLNSQILDVVQILKENDFLPAGVPNDNLSFFTKNRKAVKGKDMVSSLINKNQKESNCQLLIEMNGSKVVNQERQESQQNSGNKFLKRISICLKRGEYNILLSARQKGRFEASTAESLASIGQSFRDAEKQKFFYKQTLGFIKGMLEKDYTQNQFKKICKQYQDFINFEQIQNASKICSEISQLIQKQQLIGRQKISLTQKIEEHLSSIETLKQQFSIIQNVNTGKIKNLQNQISVKNSQNASMKSQLSILKLQTARVSQQLNAQKLKLQNIEEQKSSLKQNLQKILRESQQLKTFLQDQKSKVTQLTRQLHQKARQIQQKENQIKKIKTECNDEEILQLIKTLSKPSTIPISSIQNIEDILSLPDLAKSLTQIISNQMRKQIKQIIPLFSYDQNTQQNYTFEENSIKKMDNKQSLLFIARSQTEDKFFGAFTQEKYESDPSAYEFQEFHGVSFLFSLIDHKIEYFKNIDGQNTIIYDPNYLVFGSEDLMLNYRRKRCLSKFASGKQSLAFLNLPASSARGINLKSDINMSKKLISDQGKQECNVLQYCVFEVQFNSKK